MEVKVFGGIIKATPKIMEWLKDYDPEQYKELTKTETKTETKTKTPTKKEK